MSQVILITGTSSGFGAIAAALLAARGHRVYATMRDIGGRNKAAAAALQASSERISVLELELADTASNQAAVDEVVRREGRIDVVVNNAGRFFLGLGETFTEQDLLQIYDVDVMGPWRLVRAALPHMRRQGSGYIITVTSSLARFSCPFMTAYASAKHALEGLLHGMKHELKAFDIDFTFIEPGIFPTKVFERASRGSDTARSAGYGPLALMADQIKGQVEELFASGKAGDPALVAQAMADLVEMDRAQRPIRLPVDPSAGQFTRRVNAVHEEEYASFLTASGMGGLL